MRNYFFHIRRRRGSDEVAESIALSDHNAAMLRAVVMCGEIGCSDGFYPGFAISVGCENGAAIGRILVAMLPAASEHRDV
ncbi:MAG: hypothetical protein KF899_06750 [Parvibaculum sp.]|nr:hypothetical protein [Parvibaculum sp.]